MPSPAPPENTTIATVNVSHIMRIDNAEDVGREFLLRHGKTLAHKHNIYVDDLVVGT